MRQTCCSIFFDHQSEPQPDLALLKYRSNFYRDGYPEPKDVLLLIEISDASLEWDRQVKIPLYARAGIVESWIVDLKAKSIEVYREPVEGRYRQTRIFKGSDEVASLAFPGLLLKLDEVFPW